MLAPVTWLYMRLSDVNSLITYIQKELQQECDHQQALLKFIVAVLQPPKV